MGIGGIWQWVVVLLIVALIFGTKRLRNLGSDLGGAVKGFRSGMRDGKAAAAEDAAPKVEVEVAPAAAETASKDSKSTGSAA